MRPGAFWRALFRHKTSSTAALLDSPAALRPTNPVPRARAATLESETGFDADADATASDSAQTPLLGGGHSSGVGTESRRGTTATFVPILPLHAGALAGDQGQAIARVYDDINALRESVADVRTVVNGRMGDIQRATLVGLAREASDCGVICFCLVGCLVDSPPLPARNKRRVAIVTSPSFLFVADAESDAGGGGVGVVFQDMQPLGRRLGSPPPRPSRGSRPSSHRGPWLNAWLNTLR